MALLILMGSVFESGGHWSSVLVLLVIVVAMLTYSRLTVTVTDEVLDLRFGTPLIHKRYRLKDIKSSRTIRNRWFYGWGTRITPHGWLYNVSGLDGVEVEFESGKKIRIGTNEPQQLDAAIRSAAGLSN
ncbi:MAG: hypothetical protein ACOC9B_06095 [Chloroflexota bacterium]